ncbi:MAG: type II toxin-antitoxin system RelE/ParE family toxin [Burkholderiaceae bacterium]|nr:type II toxin-antitoxin system RelE/ParE family toxin [Burkholderiaceae bacterium]
MAWAINYTESALRKLRKLDKSIALRVVDYMDHRIAILDDPRKLGKHLVAPKLGTYWRYRVGDIRVVCNIQESEMCVLVIEIGYRREDYR